MPRAKADFTKNNGFKAFSGFWQGNPLIQPQYSADSRLFRAKQGGYPNPMPTSGSCPPFLSPVTQRDSLCAGFKPLLGKIYHETVIRTYWDNVETSNFPKISPNSQGRKVCRLKVRWLYATRPEDVARQSRTNNLVFIY